MPLRPLCCAIVLIAAAAPALAHDPAQEMAEAAQRFVASLDEAAKKKAMLEFNSDARMFWHFVPDRDVKPDGRHGLRFADMTQQQRLLAHALLSTGLSHRGYRQAITIMTLEAILHDMENKNPIRNPDLYYVAIFGEPATDRTWGWRFEGHHLSLSFTLVDGKRFSVTPSFFGTNPGHVKEGPMKGLRVLAGEEDLGRELVKSLSPEQRASAIIDANAPRDVITGQDRKADRGKSTPAKGIAFEDLSEPQQAQLLKVVNEYASRYRPEIVQQIDKDHPLTDGKGMVFAWAGGIEPGDGHYYRVQTPAFLFEYDNTQNNANHVHAVWRHFDGDFGEDLLAKHYEESHPPAARSAAPPPPAAAPPTLLQGAAQPHPARP